MGQEHKRLRTTSSSSKNDSDAVVNVPKLESLAPEFEAFKNNTGPASIIVGPDGLPSPSKLKSKEGNPSPSKSSKTQDSSEKKRSGSGSKDIKPSDPGASGSHSSPLKAASDAKKNEEKKDHKKKKEKKEKKDKKEKKHKKEKRR